MKTEVRKEEILIIHTRKYPDKYENIITGLHFLVKHQTNLSPPEVISDNRFYLALHFRALHEPFY